MIYSFTSKKLVRGVNGIKSIFYEKSIPVGGGACNDPYRMSEESLSDPGGVCTQAITVTIPQELQTRAMAADFGNGSAYAKR